MRSVLTVALSACLASISGCAVSGHGVAVVDRPVPVVRGTSVGPDHTITIAVFESRSPSSPTFTFQGVVRDPNTGEPIEGPAHIRVGIGDGPADTDPLLTLWDFFPTYENGRFTVEVPLMTTDEMLALSDPHVCFYEEDPQTGTTELVPRVAFRYAPYAWTAERARVADALSSEANLMLTPSSGWENYGGLYAGIQATRQGGMVVLNGLARYISSPTGTITELPAGFRPAGRHIFTVNVHTGTARVDVLPDGRVDVIVNSTPAGWVPLDGISFPVAP